MFSHLEGLQLSVNQLQSQGRAKPVTGEAKERRRRPSKADQQASEKLAAPERTQRRRTAPKTSA